MRCDAFLRDVTQSHHRSGVSLLAGVLDHDVARENPFLRMCGMGYPRNPDSSQSAAVYERKTYTQRH